MRSRRTRTRFEPPMNPAGRRSNQASSVLRAREVVAVARDVERFLPVRHARRAVAGCLATYQASAAKPSAAAQRGFVRSKPLLGGVPDAHTLTRG